MTNDLKYSAGEPKCNGDITDDDVGPEVIFWVKVCFSTFHNSWSYTVKTFSDYNVTKPNSFMKSQSKMLMWLNTNFCWQVRDARSLQFYSQAETAKGRLRIQLFPVHVTETPVKVSNSVKLNREGHVNPAMWGKT